MILILLIVKSQATIQLGKIQNANWILNSLHINKDYINVTNITCQQCLCQMIQMNNLTKSIACQQYQMTCQLLFWNVTAQLQIDTTSVVYFQIMPTFLQASINQQTISTSISSKCKKISE